MNLRALVLACCLSCAALQPSHAASADAALAKQVNAFVDGWHDDAAHARMVFFDKMAPDGVYIGTDRGEHWDREAFRAWARDNFEHKHRGWTFHATRRNVYVSDDGKTIWFDELLDTQMGHCMSSGVLRRTAGGFEVLHYQLSLAVPNEAMKDVMGVVQAAEAKTK